MFCFHKKWGEVKKGYQYCEKCGFARSVPKEIDPPCSHKWTKIGNTNTQGPYGNIFKNSIVLECKECGDIKNVDFF